MRESDRKLRASQWHELHEWHGRLAHVRRRSAHGRGAHATFIRNAFTLLELLIVIGIFAIVIAITLPAITRVRSLAMTVSCESNLRTLYTACVQYNTEYDGRYPFGFAFDKFNPNTGRPATGFTGYITWFSSFDKYLTARTNEIIPLDFNTGFIDGATTRVFNAAFKCPSIPAQFQQQVHYYHHGVAMPLMPLELGLTPAGRVKLRSPARVSQVYPDTALLWDTLVFGDAAPQTPAMFWGSDHTITGYSPFCTFIDDNEAPSFSDNGLLCHPEYPERRFRAPGADRFSTSSNALKNPSGPIAWASDALMQQISPGFPSMNADGIGGLVYSPGNARFRHTNLGCNVLFADGSVRTLFLRPRIKVSNGQTGAANFYDSDLRRYMLMIKWPGGGIVDSNTYPTE